MASTDHPQELLGASKTLTAQCHCKATHFTVTVPTSALPLPVHLCSCSICRHTHGTLCTFHAPLPKGVELAFVAPSSLAGSLTGYRHAAALRTRYFCSTCGCHVGDADVDVDPSTGKPEWRVATSVFSSHGEDTFQIRSHCFTRPPAPGAGFHDWLPRMGDRELKVWNPDDDAPAPPAPQPQPELDAAGNERLRVECHCGGVSFTAPRPVAAGAAGGDELIGPFVSPLNPDRWVSCIDLCDDCRLVNGTHFGSWTFLPLGQFEPAVGRDLRIGTLKTYASSPDVLRSFCGVCGATVFYCSWDRTSERDLMVDVSVGVLRAPEGAMAENWLTWRTGAISYYAAGEKYHEVFAKSLRKGLDEWGLKTYGQSTKFKIG